jgi:hypothetical protein
VKPVSWATKLVNAPPSSLGRVAGGRRSESRAKRFAD